MTAAYPGLEPDLRAWRRAAAAWAAHCGCLAALLAASGALAQARADGPAPEAPATAGLSTVPGTASAQPALPEVIVTATRQPQRVDETVSDVTVIGRAQIERAAGRTLAALLAEQPGVQTASNGGLGTASSVFLRGAESRHTLLLIDGVRYGSATLGLASFENIPLEQIERIEIVRGPMSSLYGPDAVGGVIQVFTRRGGAASRPSANLTLGSERYAAAGAGIGGASDNGVIDYGLNVQRQRTRGFSATNPRAPFGQFNPDRDGFEQTSVSANLGARLAADWRASAFVLDSRGTAHFDDGAPPGNPGVDTRSRVRSTVGGLGLDGRLSPIWRTQLRVGQSRDLTDTIAAAQAFNLGAFRTTQAQLTWQNDIATPLGTVLAAVEQLRQRVASTSTDYAVSQRTINALVLGLNGAAGAHHWQASTRRDHNSQFGGQTTGSAGYGYDLTPRWRVGLATGTTFVAPSFNQLYFPDFGNPNLQPERGRQREASVRYAAGGHEVRLVAYDNRIRGFIPSGPRPVNVPRARIEGVTLAYSGRFGPLALSAALDALDPRDEATGRQLPRRASRALTTAADWVAGDWSVGATLNAAGQRYDDPANTSARRLGGYGWVGLRARRDLSRAWQLAARLDNVTDRAIENVLGYNQPGRQFFVTLRWMPQ